MYESEQTAELATALAKAQGEMKPASLNRINPYYKSRYADLASISEAIRKALSDNGLSYTQTTHHLPDGLYLYTTLRHTSGQWIMGDYPLPWPIEPQKLGAALTYARRQSLSAITGIVADEDDDANAIAPSNGKVIEVGTPISDEQVDELLAQLKASESNLEDFLIWVRIAHPKVMGLPDIPADYFKIALNKIKYVAKAKQRKAEEAVDVK